LTTIFKQPHKEGVPTYPGLGTEGGPVVCKKLCLVKRHRPLVPHRAQFRSALRMLVCIASDYSKTETETVIDVSNKMDTACLTR
jgi:hypothetical protein